MKSVLISIKPKWCELIASGKKTIEVRKTRPKCDMPFKCYIYCTNDYRNWATKSNNCEFWVGKPLNNISKGRYFCNGKVIGEFLCDSIFTIWDGYAGNLGDDCLTFEERENYLKGNNGYGWHISDLVIYDEPKDLDDFMAFGKTHCNQKNCGGCLYMGIDGICDVKDIGQPMTRPPRSWCYVEDVLRF